ncbi:MAG: hypothetical protein Ct9H300mP6_18830 [Gammaproteobacteria bacterium]|nr:MAG: hypothetical protein Ct9H300mP6_18830 [Gammaproteobacteria bacterium]
MNEKLPPIEHPIIRTHPETGKKLIYVNEIFTSHIKGLNINESDAILEFLYKHYTTKFQCRFIGEKNSIAFWDNQITQHFAVGDYSSLRVMQGNGFMVLISPIKDIRINKIFKAMDLRSISRD